MFTVMIWIRSSQQLHVTVIIIQRNHVQLL